MKRAILLPVLAALLLPLSALALTETVDGITWIYTISNGGASVGGGSSSSQAVPTTTTGAISIPTKLGGYTVTSIGSSAFSYCSGLTSVTIPDSVTSIGDRAFYNCSGLTSVTIPDSVTSIGDMAFYDCSGLTAVTIPGSVTSIGNWVFENCSGLTSVTIGDGVSMLGIRMFCHCDGLTSVAIPDSVTSIGYGAFLYCYGLESVTIGAGLVSFDSAAFNDCPSFTSFHVSEENRSFASVNGLLLSKNGRTLVCGVNGEVTIPDSVTSIGDSAFSGCRGLTSVTIPDSVTSIGYRAFEFCSGLTAVTIPDSVTSIGDNAFYYCDGLTSVTIPDSVTSIGDRAFSGCSNIRDVVAPGRFQTSSIFSSSYSSITNAVIAPGTTSIGDRAFQDCRGLTSVTIPDSVTSIGDRAFYNCSGLTSVTIPDSVTSIGDSAFYNCSGLTSVTIPDSVTSIGDSAFYNCSGLSSVTIPGSVTSIGDWVFENCSGLTSVTIGDGVSMLGIRMFCNCDGLMSVTIPDSVTSIGDGAFLYCYGLESVTIGAGLASFDSAAFYDCPSFTSFHVSEENRSFASVNGLLLSKNGRTLVCGVNGEVTIPDSVTSIGDSAFSGCSGLTSVTIPDSVTSIGDSAFYNCTGLTSVTIPDSVTSIGDRAFQGCSGLTSMTIPDSVTSIGDGAFLYCSGLTSVTIPDSVTSIGYWAFKNCSGLTSMTIPDSVTSIGDYAFENCSGLTSMTIPDSVTSIGDEAFSGCSGLKTLYLPNTYSGTPSVPSGCTIFRYVSTVPLLVVSDLDGADPSAGTHNVPSNCVFACSSRSLVADPENPNVRYVCAGWAGTGSVPASGSGTSVSFTLVEASSITWLWETQSRIGGGDGGGADVWSPVPQDAPWSEVEEATAADGVCLQSGEIAQGGTSALEATVTGAGRLSFAWKIAANRSDYARFYLDGAKQAEITRSTDWTTVSLELGEGEHALRWAFERGSAAGGAAFLDDLLWTPFHSLAVASTDGTPTPAAGTHTLDWGTEVAASVAPPAAANGTRRACTGWTGTGSVPESGTVTNVAFTIREDSSITWNWRTEHWIDVAVTDGGTTAFQPQWVPEGGSVTATLSPSWTFCDIALSGDTNGLTRSGNTFSIPADGPRTIRATITKRKVRLTVSTPVGEVSPAPGTYEHSYGDSITASAVSPFSERNGVQVACAGWTGTGSVPSSGSGTNRTFTITQDSSITWKWTTNVWIDVAVASGGTTSFSPQWVRKGSTATVDLSPNWQLYDIALSGDTEGVTRDDRYLYVPADAPRTIRATITERKVSLAVSSAFGTAAPSVGTHLHSWGDTVNASVAAPPETDGTRTVCTGWTGTGSVPASGTGSVVSFTMQEDSTLSWRWRTDHWIAVETKGPVETGFEDGWRAAGETLEVAYDVLYEGDCKLTLGGDTNGVVLDATARMLSIPCDGPRDIVLASQPTVEEELTLATALDAPELVWTSAGANAWTPQTATTADGEDAAASGAAGSAGGGDSLLATTLSGPGTLSWSWRLETAGGSGIDLLIDGATPRYIEGDRAGAWVDASVAIAGAGTHEVQFVFWNETGAAADRGYLDRVSWTGAVAGGDTTATTPEPVPHEWLVSHGLAAAGASAAAFEAAANAKAANGRPVWECYVAGLDPTKNEDFRAAIDLDGGEPVVTWWPSNVAGRAYTVWGKSNLADEWAHPVKPAHRFFQVRVAVGSASGVDERAWPGSVEVAFDPAGGTVNPATRTYDAPGALGSLPVPERVGCEFLGWWTREMDGVPATETTAVPWCDWTLYARWRVLDPVADALNSDLVFTKGGIAEWFAQSEVSHDGFAAARSGVITDSQSTWIETTVTGAGTVSFWWKVSSESGYDYLQFYVDGLQQTSASGTSSGWSQKTFTVSGSGSHTLRWTYSKDGSASSGSDCGWVDEVVWTPVE